MAIRISTLRSAARFGNAPRRTLVEARSGGLKTAFLCHSHKDRELAQGLINQFEENGWKLYVDWADDSMPAQPDRVTAENIQQRILDLDYFLFLATPNSMHSRWCPWEIGFADGRKNFNTIFVIQTIDDDGQFHGNEYLGLYRRIDNGMYLGTSGLAAFNPSTNNGIWIRDLR